jgi:hypothetical protein
LVERDWQDVPGDPGTILPGKKMEPGMLNLELNAHQQDLKTITFLKAGILIK